MGHRKYFKDVDSFGRKSREISEASNSIIQDTTKVFKNSILNVNSSIEKVNKTMLQYNKELEIANNEGSSREKRAQLSKGDREEIKTISKNVDEKGNDDDPSLSNESSTSSNSGSISGSTPQTINSDENCEPVVDSTQDIEATIIIDVDETLETLAKETLVRNEEWIIGFGKINVRESLKKWKREKDRPHNDLGYYDIIDLTPGSNSDFVNSLSKSEYEEVISYDPPKIPNFNYGEIKALIASDFRKAVNENFMSTRGDEDKEFAWDFAYHLGEVCLYASAEDADLKKNDAEDRSSGRKIDAVWATKPPKIGKMLKIMLNRIARVYGGDSTIFNLLKLYALQIYDHNAIVYEMTVPYRELYLFREVIRTELPTSQEMLCKSLSDLREYIMEAGLHTPPEKIKASLFVTEMTYTPPSKKDNNKKEAREEGKKSSIFYVVQ
ncbi:7416_t:CDS:10 [Rhizophagus irregularis]|nr:7416_t:CDS:10 [Rhizophagus irregularis]